MPFLSLDSSGASKTYTLDGGGQFKGTGPGGYYDYEIWASDTVQTSSMTLGRNGAFTTEWNCSEQQGDFLASRGIDLNSTKKYNSYRQLGCEFDVDWTVSENGNARLCVYGWTQDPLVEYYIVEDWKNWCPPGTGSPVGKFTTDGSVYSIYKVIRTSYTIEGYKPYTQYWSVRQTTRTSGSVDISKHFDAWEKLGLQTGNLYDVSLNVEAWESSGRADVRKNIMTIGYPIYEEYDEDEETDTTTPVVTTPVTPGKPDVNGNYFKSSFENGTGIWSSRGDDVVFVSSDVSYDGSKSLAVKDRSIEWNGAAAELDPELFIPGETYSFSIGVFQKSGKTVPIQLALQQGCGDDVMYTTIASEDVKSGEWTKLENTSFTIPEKSGTMVLYVDTRQDSGDLSDFYIDVAQGSVEGTKSPVVTGRGNVGSETAPVVTAPKTGSSGLSRNSEIKIMPVGDSITNGDGEQGGYRKYLYKELTEMGYTRIDMVGPNGKNSASANGITYDDNHAGFSGYQIKEVPGWGQQQGGRGSLYNELKNNDAVKKAQPDIILLMIGTNDLTANRSMDACASDLRAVLDYMLADMPSDSVIFLASVPEHTAYGGNPNEIANYNSTVNSVADEYSAKGKNVRFADVHGCLDGMNDIGSDQLHPNGKGYEKIGKFFAGVIDEYVSSSAPETTTTTSTTTTTTTVTTTTATTTTTVPKLTVSKLGDVNCDDTVELADAILIMQSLANPDKYGRGGSDPNSLTEQGSVNGDVDKDVAGITSGDALKIQEYLIKKIRSL